MNGNAVGVSLNNYKLNGIYRRSGHSVKLHESKTDCSTSFEGRSHDVSIACKYIVEAYSIFDQLLFSQIRTVGSRTVDASR